MDPGQGADVGRVSPRPVGLMRGLKLHTVCEEAACPNIGECWKKKHATVMILGSVVHAGLRVLQRRDRQA
jgi:hypothetical protein